MITSLKMLLVTIRKRRNLLYRLSILGLISIIFYLFSRRYKIARDDTLSIKLSSKPKYNLHCHYSVDGDVLPSVEDQTFTPGDKMIFFHETSCLSDITTRQACSIESAARLHPKWLINLLFSAPVTEYVLKRNPLALLLKFPNVNTYRVHIEQYGKDTIVENILKDKLIKSVHPIEHASDILRILTLHKFGGVYLDTDSLLIKNLDSLPSNWIAKQSQAEIASGAMGFSKTESNLTKEILRELNNTFYPECWAHNGPEAIQRVLRRLCPDVLDTNSTDDACKGLEVYQSQYFYPIHYSLYLAYFKNGTIGNMEGPYMHHMWNYLSRDVKIESDSPYAKLAKRYCPSVYVYGTNRDEFGT